MRVSERLAPWLLVGPVLLVFAVFFAVPIALLFAGSVERVDTATFQMTQTEIGEGVAVAVLRCLFAPLDRLLVVLLDAFTTRIQFGE